MASFNHTSALEQPHDLAQRRSWVDSGPYWQDREARLGVRVGEPQKVHSVKSRQPMLQALQPCGLGSAAMSSSRLPSGSRK